MSSSFLSLSQCVTRLGSEFILGITICISWHYFCLILSSSFLSLSAFGLPHTDENFYNKNLFNCLDYTNDPEENLLPGEVNMVKLKEVYLAPERERRMLRRVENSDGSVTETIGWVIKHEDHLAEAWNLDVINE